jgi:TIR domain-containing protein/uncharacterized protein DUF4384
MHRTSNASDAEVFISYASRNREQAVQLAGHLATAGVTIWRDENEILGGEHYGPKIVQGIKNCKVLVLLCTDASMRSKNVKQEIQLAWRYDRPYLPLLGEPIDNYPEQVEYWLEGWQWIEVLDRPAAQWLPRVLQALANAGVKSNVQTAVPGEPIARPTPLSQGLDGLRALARFTDQIWPVPADRVHRDATRSVLRDLGAPQDDVQHGHRLGSRVCLAIESDRAGHLLLLDEGTSGKTYCLCPSIFAPYTRLAAGRTYLPQQGSRYDAFVVSGQPGREHLLAILTDEPLGLDWMPADPKVPARVLSPADINTLLDRFRDLEADRWTALSTYFDVSA